MLQSQLIRSIQSLETGEIKRFGQFIRSPYFNKREILIQLWQYILKYSPDFQHEALQKAQVSGALFPGQSFQEKKIRDLMSDLFASLKQFWAIEEMKQRPWQADRFALSQMRARRLEKVFKSHYNALKKKLETDPKRDEDYYFVQYQLALEANAFFGQQQLRKQDPSLQEKMNALDAWYLMIKLPESCEMLNRQNVFATQYDNPLIEPIIYCLEQQEHQFWQVPGIRIYHKIFQALSAPTHTAYFEALVSLLEQYGQLFRADETRGMYKHAQNYCIRRINRGEAEFMKHIFTLYQIQLEKGIIFSQGNLAHTDYKNIVTVALRLGEFAWVEDFLYAYRERVIPQHRENVFHFSLATFYYEKGQISSAVRLLQNVVFTDVYYDISGRSLLLKCLYETQEWESALYHIQAFQVFLRRSKSLSAANRQTHLNFLSWAKKLIQLREKAFYLKKSIFRKRIEALKSQLTQVESVANLNWLQEKVTQAYSEWSFN